VRRHWALAALLACVAPLLFAFARQPGLASLSDDSASYLALAQRFAADGTPAAAWAAYAGHFPPLFPLVLALAGAADDFERAHLVVAGFAAAAPIVIYAFVLALHRRRDAALAMAFIFVVLPTAWISAKGILSEPLYLVVSLAALTFHRARLAEGNGRRGEWIAFGLLLALALLTRLAAVALLAAFALQAGLRMAAARRTSWQPLALAAIPMVALAGLWMALRPAVEGDPYQRATESIVSLWLAQPAAMASVAASNLFDGWVASFTADPDVSATMRWFAAAIGIAGIAGSARAALRNRADGWYVLGSLAMLFLWLFNADNLRRLLYPLVPLLLLHAGEAVVAVSRRLGARPEVATRWAPAVAIAVTLLLAQPAVTLIYQKARDDTPVLEGFHTTYADVTEYYTTLNTERARALAAKHAAVLSGLEALQSATTPGKRVMWMRPEYVALLGRREAVPFLYGWDAQRLAQEARAARVDYFIVAGLSKLDLAGAANDSPAAPRPAAAYAHPVLALANPVIGGDEFVLLEIERAALDAYLDAVRGDQSRTAPNTNTRRAK
jgi:hypothetical protein